MIWRWAHFIIGVAWTIAGLFEDDHTDKLLYFILAAMWFVTGEILEAIRGRR